MLRVSLARGFAARAVHENYSGRRGFNDVRSLVVFNDTFYWASAGGINFEMTDGRLYYYSTVEDTVQTEQMELYHPRAQPVPAPINTVEQLQVLFIPNFSNLQISN